MANVVLTNAFVSLNSVNLSALVRSVTLNYAAQLQDDTAMGDTAVSRIGGLKDWSLEIEFFQDYDSSKVDATLFTLVGSTFAVEVRHSAASASATNPKYTGTGILESYQPVGGAVGENLMAPVTIQGVGALTRGTS
jgi:hypothetical protein